MSVNDRHMKKKSDTRTAVNDKDLDIPELKPAFFKKAVRGKYQDRMKDSRVSGKRRAEVRRVKQTKGTRARAQHEVKGL